MLISPLWIRFLKFASTKACGYCASVLCANWCRTVQVHTNWPWSCANPVSVLCGQTTFRSMVCEHTTIFCILFLLMYEKGCHWLETIVNIVLNDFILFLQIFDLVLWLLETQNHYMDWYNEVGFMIVEMW